MNSADELQYDFDSACIVTTQEFLYEMSQVGTDTEARQAQEALDEGYGWVVWPIGEGDVTFHMSYEEALGQVLN